MKISVIIASYKRPEQLENCLQSLESQKRRPDEVIVALQTGDRESVEFAKRSKEKFNLKMALTEKKGKIFQENAALKKVSGEIVCFIDDDAMAKDDWLKRIEERYLKDDRIGGVGGRDIVHQADGTIDERRVRIVGKITWFGRSIGNHHNIVRLPRSVDFLKGCNMSYRRELLAEIDKTLLGYTVPFEEEWIGLNIKNMGYKIIYDPLIIVDHFPPFPRENYQDLRQWNTNTAFIRGHNQVYTLLSYFSLPRKLCFLLYTFFMGDFQNPGPGRLIISLLKKDFKKVKYFIHSSFRGKINGLFTYHKLIWEENSLVK